MLTWVEQDSGDHWAKTDDVDYLVSVYHHGTEIHVTGTNDDGDSVLSANVPSVQAGKDRAEQHYTQMQS